MENGRNQAKMAEKEQDPDNISTLSSENIEMPDFDNETLRSLGSVIVHNPADPDYQEVDKNSEDDRNSEDDSITPTP